MKLEEILKKLKISEEVSNLIKKTKNKLIAAPDIFLTADGSVNFTLSNDNNNFELEFFNDGDMVFVDNDNIIDISEDQLNEKINIINNVINNKKEVTTWYRFDEQRKKYLFNHYEEGWDESQDKPVPRTKNQEKDWKKAKWWKRYGNLVERNGKAPSLEEDEKNE